jgi:tetratricopeptide (TPR) repeat protein
MTINVREKAMVAASPGRRSVTGRQLHLLIGLSLSAMTLAVFWNVQFHDFILYDDLPYVVLNRHLQSGLTGGSVIWAVTTMEMSNWHPVTWLSLMLDYDFFRLNPAGYHWTNLLIHIAGTILLFSVLRRMTEDIWKSAVVAALFAIHPLHVESVAWISERKDVLSAFFWFLTMKAYVRYTERPGTGRYVLLTVVFVLGLMAKPMLVTLPFVLLLLDVWPLGRLHFPFTCSGEIPPADREDRRIAWPHALWEKIPLFFLAFLSIVITYLAQMNWNAVGSLEMFPIDIRIANALISYVHYIVKMFWPAKLAFFYPYVLWWPLWILAGAALLLAALTFLILKHRGTRPYLTVGWLWYLGTLVPVIGIVQVGSQAMADRYTYIPLIGPFMMIAWGVPELFGNWRFRRTFLSVLSGIVLTVLALSSWQQLQYWRNSVTLFEHAMSVTSGNYLAHNNLGAALSLEGRTEEALRHYSAAILIKPDYADAHNNIGFTLAAQGKYEEAIASYLMAMAIKMNDGLIRFNLGDALMQTGRIDEAASQFKEAVKLRPETAPFHNSLGVALIRQGKHNEAVNAFRTTLRLDPNHAGAHHNLAMVLSHQGNLQEAVVHFSEALRIQPDYWEARRNLQDVLKKMTNPRMTDE